MKDLKIGIYGLGRGISHIQALRVMDGVKITAICDVRPEAVERVKPLCPEDVQVFSEWDSFIRSGMDAVVLANFFHEHARYAIEAMELGVDVISECTAAVTMQECADLCRAVERTGRTYCLAENCVYELGPMEMRRVYQTGALGAAVYGEGEYVHPSKVEDALYNVPSANHWRNHCPATYYLTHSLGPLMYVTDAEVKRVIGKTAPITENYMKLEHDVVDGTGIMLCEMTDGSLFRVNGCSCHGPGGRWTRLGCSKGGCETVRGDTKAVRVIFNAWNKPEDWDKPVIYTQNVDTEEDIEKMKGDGHDGIDYRMVKIIVEDLRAGRQPYFDVYRAVNMSATAILGWRSVLNDSAQLTLPDFRDEESRKICDGDTATPFPNPDGSGDVIPSIYSTRK